jgi:hypothetical protein
VGSHISIARQRMFSVLWSDPRLYNERPTIIDGSGGDGFEYLHRTPASRRRRRKGSPVPGV